MIHTLESGFIAGYGKSYINQGIDIETGRMHLSCRCQRVVAEIIEHEIYGGSLWLIMVMGYFPFTEGVEYRSKGEKVRSGQKLGMVNTWPKTTYSFSDLMDDKPVIR